MAGENGVVRGSLSEIINKLLKESVEDENSFKFIIAVLDAMRKYGVAFDNQQAAYMKLGGEYIAAVEYDRDLGLYISLAEEALHPEDAEVSLVNLEVIGGLL